MQNTPFLYPGFYFNFFIAKKYHGPNHHKKRKEIEVYRQQRLQSKYHLNSPIPINNNRINQVDNFYHANNHNNNNNNMSSNNSNNRGRYVTSSAISELRHHHNQPQNQNNYMQHQHHQHHQHQNNNLISTPDQYHHHQHQQYFGPGSNPNSNHNHFHHLGGFNNNHNASNNNRISLPPHLDGNNNNNNHNNQNQSHLHFFPKLALLKNSANNEANIVDINQLQNQVQIQRQQQQQQHHNQNNSNNNQFGGNRASSGMEMNHNINNNKQFEDIPSYLLNDNNFDARWTYLYHSFDFKYMLLLCFVCRCLNKGELTESHHTKLGESAKIRQLTDEEFEICIDKVKFIRFFYVSWNRTFDGKNKYFVNIYSQWV